MGVADARYFGDDENVSIDRMKERGREASRRAAECERRAAGARADVERHIAMAREHVRRAVAELDAAWAAQGRGDGAAAQAHRSEHERFWSLVEKNHEAAEAKTELSILLEKESLHYKSLAIAMAERVKARSLDEPGAG